MSTALLSYPWYAEVTGDEIEQGDILEACTVFIPPDTFVTETEGENSAEKPTLKWEKRNVIVISQSCDMAKGREKLSEVLLCPLWTRSQLTGTPLASDKEMEHARRGNYPGYHVINSSSLQDFEREVRVVDFRRVYSLPIGLVRKHAESAQRIRLLPPYREHLSQAFARFFMRVGLPSDVPAFVQPKK